ncbi:MAG TPA: LptF/LptG family permease [bacterium]|nr:LptF/LptG family permease [bacterium]
MTVTLLDRLLWAEVGSSFTFSLGLFSVLLVMNHLFYLARLVIGQGIAVQTALVLMIYKIPYFIAFSVPMGVLLATVLGVGRLTDHNEIAALRVAGISLYRIAVPVVAAGAVATLGGLIFSEGVVSLSDARYRVVFNDVMSHGPDLRPVNNVFFQAPTTGGNALYSAHRYEPQTRTLVGVTVLYLNAGQPLEIIQAQTATYRRGVEWTFHRGNVYAFQHDSVVTTAFDTLAVTVPRSPQEFTVPPEQPSDMNMRELTRQISMLHREGADARAFVGELNSRFANAASCIVFALVALPLSLRPHRSGPSMGLGLSILVLVAYYIIAIPSQLASDGRVLSPVLAAWLPDAVVGAGGAILLARAAR